MPEVIAIVESSFFRYILLHRVGLYLQKVHKRLYMLPEKHWTTLRQSSIFRSWLAAKIKTLTRYNNYNQYDSIMFTSCWKKAR